MSPPPLVFWQNILSPHQAPFLRALAGLGYEVTVVAVESMTEDRLGLGWKVPDLGCASVVVAPDGNETRRLIESSSKEAVHVMAGARLCLLGRQALEHCITSGRRLGIMSEAPDPRGLLGFGRWAKYTIERCTKGARYRFVVAMGQMGVNWFRRCGYSDRRLFPFAYVTDPIPLPHTSNPAREVSLLYAGRFVALKGLDILLRAFAAMANKQVRLNLVGYGPERQRLQDQARALAIQDRVTWLDHRDSEAVQREMEKADVTLLPSRHDGWGAVVNESLMAGTPVTCSTACGAAELIRAPWLGTVFQSGSVPDLTRALEHWVGLGPRSQVERERIRSWSSCISGEAVAKYFAAILEHVYSGSARPTAPWRLP